MYMLYYKYFMGVSLSVDVLCVTVLLTLFRCLSFLFSLSLFKKPSKSISVSGVKQAFTCDILLGYAACLATIMINCKTAVQKQHAYACIWSASSNRVSLWMCYVLLCCWLCSGVWVFSSACLKKPANPRLFQFWIWNNPCCFYSNFTVNVHVAK